MLARRLLARGLDLSIRQRLLAGPLVTVLALAAAVAGTNVAWYVEIAAEREVRHVEAQDHAVSRVGMALAQSYALFTSHAAAAAMRETAHLPADTLRRSTEAAHAAERLLLDHLPDEITLHHALVGYALELDTAVARTAWGPRAHVDAISGLHAAHHRLHDQLERTHARLHLAARTTRAASERTVARARGTNIVIAAVAAVLVLLGGGLTARAVLGPLDAIMRRTVRLADGDLETPIPGRDRGHEIGAVAAALEVFRQNALDLHHLAYRDPLTGLANRASCQAALARAVAAADRGEGPFALLLLDLDRFKEVNDSLGHGAGDRLLVTIAERLVATVGPGDLVARLGGDEFAVIHKPAEAGAPAALAARCLARLSADVVIDQQTIHVGVSIGIASHPEDGRDGADLLKHADLALYEAKTLSRQTYRLFEPRMSDELMDRRALERDLRAALADGALRFVFQPKRRLSDRALVGVETLVRWQRTSGDIVSPAAFVAVAEQTGLIEELGLQALEAACRAAARWRRTAGAPFTVAVNASVVQLKRGDFAAAVEAALARHGLPAAALIVEITENVFIDDDAEVQAALRRLGATGVRLALDDFGTGYASLGYLRRLPFSELKIDRSFVRDLAGCADARALVRAIVGLGHALDMKVTAEGIETPAQLAFLAAEGCDDGQGYFLGRPQEAGGIDRLLAPTAVPGDLEAL